MDYVDVDLLKVKWIYFIQFAMLTCLTFLPVLYQSLGISLFWIGAIGALEPLMMFFGTPIWGGISDRWNIHQAVALFCLSCFTLFAAVPYLLVEFFLGFNSSYVCEDANDTTTSVSRLRGWLNPNNVAISHTTLVAIIVGSAAIGRFIHGGTPALVDAGVMNFLGDRGQLLYGKQRLWGAISYGIMASIVGFTISETCNILSFYYYFFAFSVIYIVTLCFFKIDASKHNETTQLTSEVFWEKMLIIVNSYKILSFLCVIFVIGNANGALYSLLFVFLKNLGASETLLGLTVFVMCFAEVILFFFSPQILEKLGHIGCLYITLTAFSARFFWYSNLTNPWWVFPAEVMHGITWAIMWTAAVSYAKLLAPSGVHATMQSILNAVLCLGQAAGSLVAGILYQEIGSMVYRYFAYWLIGAFIFYFCFNWIHARYYATEYDNPEEHIPLKTY
jgi:MFS family permease